MQFRSGLCAVFIFSLTSSALVEKLHVAEMPHMHAEVIKQEVVPCLSSVSASGGSGRLTVSVGDHMAEMRDSVRTTLAW
jgi:hypothetical protein